MAWPQVQGQDRQQEGHVHAVVVEGREGAWDWGREGGEISSGEGETSEVGGEVQPEEGLDGDGLLGHLLIALLILGFLHKVIHPLHLLGWYELVQGHAPSTQHILLRPDQPGSGLTHGQAGHVLLGRGVRQVRGRRGVLAL